MLTTLTPSVLVVIVTVVTRLAVVFLLVPLLAFAVSGCGATTENDASRNDRANDLMSTESSGVVRIPVTNVGAAHWDSPLIAEKPPEIVATTYRVVGDIDVSDVNVRLLEREGGFFVRVSYVVDSVRGSGAIEIIDAEAAAASNE